MSDEALLRQLTASVRELAGSTRPSHRRGPFLVFVDALSRNKYLSFAQPDDDAAAEELADALPSVLALFGEHDRLPRTEHIEEVCPALTAVVEDQGWTLSERVPIMVVTPEALTLPPAPDGLSIERLGADTPEDMIRRFWQAQDEAFVDEPNEELTPELLARWRERAADSFHFAAVLGDDVIGTAIAMRVVSGVSEVVGVATVPEHRRRGIAGAVTGAAVAAAFAGGAQVAFLSAADAGAERIYARAGFRLAGWQRGYDGPPA